MDIALSSLEFAFESVKANQGCAGVDGVTVRRFEDNLVFNLKILQSDLYSRMYRPLPVMKVLIPKKDEDKPRVLCIPSIRDRVIQKAVLNLIEPVLDKEFEDCSFAYRKGYSVKRAVYQIKAYYNKGYHWIIDADVDDFFDNVDHDRLMEKFKPVIDNEDIRHLVRLWLKTEIWDGETLTIPEKGIPQGSPISPVLANLFLDEIDEQLAENGFKYVRYADNYLLLGKNENEARKGLALSMDLLDRMDLDLDVEAVSCFEKGFQYLGVFFFNDLVMKPFDPQKDGKGKQTPVFPKPFNMEAWMNHSQKKR